MIRTKNNHILGPISREKMIELYQNESVKKDDELSTGNGYWFFVKETELVNKYLLDGKAQSFNPVSEAEDVLTANQNSATADITSNDSHLVPDDSDLEYPDLTLDSSDNLEGEEVSLEADSDSSGEMNPEDLEYPDMTDLGDDLSSDSEPHSNLQSSDNIVEFKSNKQDSASDENQYRPEKENIDLAAPVHPKDHFEKDIPSIPPKVAKKSFLTLNTLIGLVITFLLMLATAVYFRASIINALRKVVSIVAIEKVYAQEDRFFEKKK